jgi:hypothetical protein
MGISFFSATFVWNMFCPHKYSVNYTQDTCINACRSSCKVSCYCFSTSTKIGMWWHNLVKLPYNIFHDNPCTDSWALTYRQPAMVNLTGTVLQLYIANLSKSLHIIRNSPQTKLCRTKFNKLVVKFYSPMITFINAPSAFSVSTYNCLFWTFQYINILCLY